eukprot:SAG11_NODE_28392_length_322_cov_0.739910_1_plen_79_part_10
MMRLTICRNCKAAPSGLKTLLLAGRMVNLQFTEFFSRSHKLNEAVITQLEDFHNEVYDQACKIIVSGWFWLVLAGFGCC